MYILLAIVVLLAIILIYATTKPDTVHYERSAIINAPPERILPHIDDLRKWTAWSPYEKIEPDMQRTYSGAAQGRGAKYAWDGKKGGAGSMEILETSTARVKIDLRFIRPFKSNCMAYFTFVPQGGSTQVTWSLDGPSPYISKLMGLFMDFDKRIGKDFSSGLTELKRIAETK